MQKVGQPSTGFKAPRPLASFDRSGITSGIAAMGLSLISAPYKYADDAATIAGFLAKFETLTSSSEDKLALNGDVVVRHKYQEAIQAVADHQSTHICVDLDDVWAFENLHDGDSDATMSSDPDSTLYHRIVSNTHRYVQLFSEVVDKLMPKSDHALASMSPIDVIAAHRESRLAQKNAEAAARLPEEAQTKADAARVSIAVPPGLLRRYTLSFKPSKAVSMMSVRQVKADHVGQLVTLKGIVTRVSEVKPLLSVATYTCDTCSSEVYQEVNSSVFMPVLECPSFECRRRNVKGQLHLQTRGSRFIKLQEGRLQELTDQVPMGHIPRSMAVQFYGDLTRTCNPGDHVVLSGIFMPRPYMGIRAIKAGLLTDTYLLVQHVQQVKTAPPQLSGDSALVVEQVASLKANPGLAYRRLAASIAPEIFGHEDVKRAILLLILGGVALDTKTSAGAMHIRGDINVCLMGDPGVAKSQLLKWVAKTSPRAVYTTGKGSSGVGLTAAVTKDPLTNEMILEGGALVLADNVARATPIHALCRASAASTSSTRWTSPTARASTR